MSIKTIPMKKSILPGLAIALLICLGCNPPSRPPEIVDGKLDSIQEVIQRDSSEQPLPIPDNYTVLHNIELTDYCLPYPAADFKEDFEANEGKGSHILRSNDKSIRLTFRANPLDMTFEQLYELSVRDIQSITGAAPLIEVKEKEAFELQWKEKGKMVRLKKWYRPKDNETVTARFDYDPDVEIGELYAIVASQSTYCKPE